MSGIPEHESGYDQHDDGHDPLIVAIADSIRAADREHARQREPRSALATERIMRAVAASPTIVASRRPSSRVWRSRGVASLLAASLVVAVGVTALRSRSASGVTTAILPLATSSGNVDVRFALSADAQHVALVGDFNGWNPNATPLVRDATGTWVVATSLPAGRHVYAFVVNDKQWIADPSAPLAPEDGFGSNNSVVIVSHSDRGGL